MRRLLLVAALLLLTGCGGGEAGSPAGSGTPPASSSPSAPSASPSPSATASSSGAGPAVAEPELREELLAMLERDQSGRTGGPDPEGDAARTARLAEVLDRHGWPGRDLVGEDGAEAAWAIAQHSDLDPAFQRRALESLRQAVAAGQASAGDLAYLTDRVATGAGEPQTYGTQVACTPGGPQPATPLVDAAAVERLRAEAGLQPYDAYLAEMAAICAEE